MTSAQSLSIQDAKLNSLGLTKAVVNAEQVVVYSRSLDAASEKNPILVLIHGYPQSSYEWRHLIPLLPSTAPLFIPDLPGYGGSACIPQNDKLSIGKTILSALQTSLRTASTPTTSPTPIILIGHDRGARIAHRLTVSTHEAFTVIGTTLLDIVPTSTQWLSSNPTHAPVHAKEATGYFHWAFLANAPLATRMIKAYGGARWVREMISSWAGTNAAALDKLHSDDALNVYGGFFESEDTIRASCEDYRAGAGEDLLGQDADQKAGRKIEVPLLLIYAEGAIGKRYDFGTVWREWVGDGVEITRHGLGDGVGHFGPEEAPEECAEVIGAWLKGLKGVESQL